MLLYKRSVLKRLVSGMLAFALASSGTLSTPSVASATLTSTLADAVAAPASVDIQVPDPEIFTVGAPIDVPAGVMAVSGTISQDATWTLAQSPVVISGAVTVAAGAQLTIEPGTVVKFSGQVAALNVNGTLTAVGTPAERIVFTSIKDDTHGGDTNNNGSASVPATGDWNSVLLNAGAGASRIEYADLLHGGSTYEGYSTWRYNNPLRITGSSPQVSNLLISGSKNACVYVDGATAHPVIRDSVIERGVRGVEYKNGASGTLRDSVVRANTDGVLITASAPTVTGVTVQGNAGVGVWVSGACAPALTDIVATGNGTAIRLTDAAAPVLSGMSGSGNGYNAIALSGTRSAPGAYTLVKEGLPYVIDSYYTISTGVQLTIEPGTVVKFSDPTANLTVNGTLTAVGTPAERIVFTSIKDDTHGGDTNNNGSASVPVTGDWNSVLLNAGAGASRIEYADLLHGGSTYEAYSTWRYNNPLRITGSSPQVGNLLVSGSKNAGVYVDGATARPVIRDSVIERGVRGVEYKNGSAGTLRDSVVRTNTDGVRIDASSPTVTGCTIKDNTSRGVHITGTSHVTLNYNDLYRNGTFGQTGVVAGTTDVVDARYNYWGAYSGPTASEQLTVLYEPWATTPWATTRGKMVFGGDTPCGIYGEPINTATGNFYFEAADLSLPGVGPSIGLSRTYNHQDATKNGILGYGWTLNCESSVQVDASGTATVGYPGGSRKDFTPDGQGGFTSPSGTLDHLAANTNGTYNLTTIDRQVLRFGTNNLLLSVTDRNGNVVSYVRDGLGNLTDITASGGRAIHLTYSGGFVSGASDNAGRTVTYGHNPAGDLTSIADALGNATKFAYDSQHRVTSVASPKHPTTPFVTNVYDDQDRVTTQFDGYGFEMSFAYNDGTTVITDNRGGTLRHLQDESFRLLSTVDAAGNAQSKTYNAAGLVDSVTDGRGKVSHLTYDANGNPTGATDPDGHGSTANYDLANNNVLWTQDALGHRTTYSYDASGTNMLSVLGPVGSVAMDYYVNGLVHHTASAGATTTFEYTTSGLPSRITNPLGFSSTLAYDAAGRITSVADAEGRSVETSMDAAGRTTRIEDALDHSATFSYDANGNQTSATDARSKTTSFTYDVMDKLVGVTDALSNLTGYTYDKNYNLSSVTNARSNTTSYTYTANDLLERVTDPLSRTWTFDHDAAGNLTKTAYPSGSTATRTFNDDELLESLTAGPLGYTFAYSPTHALTSVTDTSSRTWVYEYDEGDRLTRASDTVDPAVSGGFDVARSYDAAGNVSGIRASGEGTRTYAYDLAGRLTSLALPSDPGTATAFVYDRSGLLTGRTLPDGSVASWVYDAAGRLSSIADTMPSGVLAFDYMRDANGNVTAENDARYGYDAPNRLTSWYDPSTDATTTYDYDAAYNLTGVSVDGSTTASFAFDAADRISSPGYTYDANGNMTSDGAQTYDYDTLNRLSRVKDAEGTAIATYAYDASNRRISSTDSSGTTFFHYDGASPNVIAETDGAGGTIATYAYDAAGRLHSMTRSGETYYYHSNGHGDVVALTDENGDVVNSYRYDPWGKVLSASETVANPYRYAGYRYDAATGLYQLWNRYYSPKTMRFITKDLYPGETRAPGTMNGYAYCLGNPVNAVDPSGRSPLVGILGISAAGLAEATFYGAAAYLAISGVIDGGADIAAYAPVHDDFMRCHETAAYWADQNAGVNPELQQMWLDIDKANKEDQIAAYGKMAEGFYSMFAQ